MRNCCRCKELKELNLFPVDKRAKLGRGYTCIECKKITNKEQRLKRDYGVTPEIFEALLKSQNNKCAICETDFTSSPNIDHCHNTGKVRGLLCTNCNLGIGNLKDDIKIIQAAISYLKRP